MPNLTIGPMLCDALRNYGIEAPIDVHLMIEPVDRIIPDFAKAGASFITFHPEASRHVDRSLGLIRDQGCKAGLVLNPATPLDCLTHVIDKVDMILIMSVNPGFGGQSFIPSALTKLRQARQIIEASKRDIRLEIDGGVKVENIGDIAAAGADTFVAGSAIFGSKDYAATTDVLTKIPNRLAFEQRFEFEVENHKASGEPLVLLLWDVDHFKRVNDDFGHAAGDKVLKMLAGILHRNIRGTDFTARLGGEEFVMLMTGSPIDSCLAVANKLRSLIRQMGFHFRGKEVVVTASCGLTEYRKGESLAKLLDRADRALYRAKELGRDKCLKDS